jgi:hypothetical protein
MPFMTGESDEGLTMDEASFVESWTYKESWTEGRWQRVSVVLRPRSSGRLALRALAVRGADRGVVTSEWRRRRLFFPGRALLGVTGLRGLTPFP